MMDPTSCQGRQQNRVTAMHGSTRSILARLHRLGVLVVWGIMLTNVSAFAHDQIDVPNDFATIQAALNAATPGARIKVHPGTYTEEIVIAKDVILEGAGVGKTIIKAPSTLTSFALHLLNGKPVAALARITDGANVRMSGFTLTGPVPCAVNAGGVRVVKAATLALSDSHVTSIRPADGTPCPPEDALGVGVVIGLPDIIEIDGQGGSTAHGSVSHVTVDSYQTTGIVVVGPFGGSPSTATISHNVVVGGTPFPIAGQVGISVADAAVAQVTRNTVRDTVCTNPFCGRDPMNEAQSVGLLALFIESPGTVFEDNTAVANDIGLALFASEGCCRTRGNKLSNNHFFGILVQDGSNDTEKNHISGGEVGIGVVADFIDTVAVLRGDKIKGTSVLPVQELSCCGVSATAIVQDH